MVMWDGSSKIPINTPHPLNVPLTTWQVDYRRLCNAVNPHFDENAHISFAWTALEKRRIIPYLCWGAPKRTICWAGKRRFHGGAAKGMRVEEFVVVPGSAPAAGGSAKAAVEALRAAAAMKQEDESELRAQLAQLRQEHRDLDVAIEALHNSPGADRLQVQRLKKRKLQLRDRIIQIEDQLTPDIIA
jgi:hypothetical protein